MPEKKTTSNENMQRLGAYGASPAPKKSNKMPKELQQQLDEIEEWALTNKKDSKKDAINFWILKIPAIVTSASAGIWAHFDLTTVSVISGAIASICVVLDGIHPRGMLKNIHTRAYHDLRMLSGTMTTAWRSRDSFSNVKEVAQEIIRNNEEERLRIASYIRDAESALAYKQED
jgi:hypothetical protein